MSALGQKRTCAVQPVVSAYPNSDREREFPQKVMSASKADMCGAIVDVCFGPKADKPRRISSEAVSQSGADVKARERKSHAR
jgi:hypothetical protein